MNKKISLLAGIAIVVLVAALALRGNIFSAPMTKAELSENGFFIFNEPRGLNEFTLTDHTGKEFNRAIFNDKWTLVFFGYTYCPDICPITMATISQFSRLLEESPYSEEYSADTQVVMISVDPERDTLEVLETYVAYFNEGYLGVTGEFNNLTNIAAQLNVAFAIEPQESGDYLVSHSGQISLINPRGEFHGFFKIPHQPEQMSTNYQSVRDSW